MKKIRWKRFAALALAVMLFAGAVPVAAPVQAYASEVSVYSDKIQRGKTGKSMTLSFTIKNTSGSEIKDAKIAFDTSGGEIWDEDDVVEEPYIALPDGGWDCTAEMTVSDVFELLELDGDDDDEFTNKLLGEWAYEQFDAIPSVGDSFEYENVGVTVSEMRNNRILRLRVRLTDKGGEEK